jgi:hypothetical protein
LFTETQDNIFLLSYDEVLHYFSGDNDRVAVHLGGSYVDFYSGQVFHIETNTQWEWWLRTPGWDSYLASLVNKDGSVNNDGYIVADNIGGVRPALWLNIGDETNNVQPNNS